MFTKIATLHVVAHDDRTNRGRCFYHKHLPRLFDYGVVRYLLCCHRFEINIGKHNKNYVNYYLLV